MIPKDFQYKNISVSGKLVTGKLSVPQFTQSEMSATIAPIGPNTIFKRIFTTAELPDPNQGDSVVDYTITIDTKSSQVGDRLLLFFVTPFLPNDGPYSGAALRIVMPNSVFVTACAPPYQNTSSYKIYHQSKRFLLNLVFNGEKFINTVDSN